MKLLTILTLVVISWGMFGYGQLIEQDKKSLLNFLSKQPKINKINWKKNSSICLDWFGISCNDEKTRVIAVRLPAVGFNGQISSNTISRLASLQILNLEFNNFSGSLFSVDFSVLKNLTYLNLSNNKFNGSLPKNISNLTQLLYLNLANNSLSGLIPDLELDKLVGLDLSFNNFSGVVPKSLERFMGSGAFKGSDVVSVSQSVLSPVENPKTEEKAKNRVKGVWFLVIVVGCGCLGVFAFGFLLCACCCLKRKGGGDDQGFNGKFPKGSVSVDKGVSSDQDAKNNGIVFFEGCSYAFDLEDLLRASAEVLGKGTFGMSYKAILEDANVVVVKRLKEVSVGKREFEQQMDLIGSVKHDNVVALRAFYYSKDEKLMVNDCCCHGSVSARLHTQRGQDRIPLNWESRLKIAIGAARGIAHLHSLNGGKFVHGNIRSSNIFLNFQKFGCVSDFGLATIMTSLPPPISRAAGYRAPEVTDTRKPTQPSDVYSFGVFLLELLTGKSPVHATGGDELVHLVRWVHSVVREEWTAEVFDLELLRHPHVEEEMVEMLQISLTCVARVPDQRPKMSDLMKVIEDVRHSFAETQSTAEL